MKKSHIIIPLIFLLYYGYKVVNAIITGDIEDAAKGRNNIFNIQNEPLGFWFWFTFHSLVIGISTWALLNPEKAKKYIIEKPKNIIKNKRPPNYLEVNDSIYDPTKDQAKKNIEKHKSGNV